jgi:ABC-type molybdate transport system ATPase subunit
MKKIDINGRIIRWLLLLQEFDLTILDKPRKQMLLDFLSRLTNNANEKVVNDSFPR